MTNKDLSPGANVARGATYIFIQGLLSAALGVVYIVFLTRLLSQEEIGTFGVLTFILGLIQILGLLSLPSASVKYMAQFIAEGKREKAKAVVVRVLQVSIIIAVAAFAVVFVLSSWISNILSSSPLVVQVLALASVFVVLYFQAFGFLQGLQMMREMAAVNLLYTIIQYSLALYLVIAGYGLLGIIIGWTAGLIISSILALALTAKNLGVLGKPHELKPLLRFSSPVYISSILGFFVQWIDQLFVLPYMGLASFGIYNIANRAAVVPALISSALIAALFPKLSQLYAEVGKDSLENAFTVTTRYVVLVGFPMILLVAVLAYPIMILFAGAQYVPAALPLVVLCVATLFGTLGVAIGPTLFTIERTGIASVLTFASVVADALFSFIFIAILDFGMIGAATAKVIAAMVGFFFGIVILMQFIKVKFDSEMLWKVSFSCFFMVATVLGFDLLRQFLSGPPYHFLVFRLMLLPVYIIVGGVAYIVAIIALGAIKKEDLELFREYLPKKLKWTIALFERFVRNKRVV